MSHTLNRTAAQFWANIDKSPNGCWLWRGGRKRTTSRRYAKAIVDGKLDGVHRIAYELAKGAIPAGKLILHSCDTPLCINPEHLTPGTYQENMEDMSQKGRSVKGKRRPGTGPAGRRNSHAVLTPEMVKQLRSEKATLTHKELAAKYGISKSQVQNILSRQQWRDL